MVTCAPWKPVRTKNAVEATFVLQGQPLLDEAS